jgi:hypothetical protein
MKNYLQILFGVILAICIVQLQAPVSQPAQQEIVTTTTPVNVGAYVSSSGKLAIFGTTSLTPSATGVFLHPPIKSIVSNPIIYVNGSQVQIGPPTWRSEAFDNPCVAYLLQCGSVQSIAIQSGGSGYTNPTISTTASGLTFGTPTLATGVTGYTINAGGSGYNSAPNVIINDPTGTGASAYAIVFQSGVVQVVVTNGGTGYTNPTITFSGSVGTGAVAIASQQGGIINSIRIIHRGSGYSNPPNVIVAAPANGLTAQNLAVVQNGTIINVIPLSGGVLGYGTNYTAAPKLTIDPPPVSTTSITATITPNVSTYISSIPVTNGGLGLSSPPPITITDPTGTGASAYAMMSGPSASDIVTYSASNGWLPGASAISNGIMMNWVGQLEGPTNGLLGFTASPTMKAGGNLGSQPSSPGSSAYTAANYDHVGPWNLYGNGILKSTADGVPISWTSPTTSIVYKLIYGNVSSNFIDNNGQPNFLGPWTVQYDDPNVNTPQATCINFVSATNQSSMIPVNTNGSGATGTVTLKNGTISAVNITNGGSGYQAAIGIISGNGGAAMIMPIVQNGQITSCSIICPGKNYSGSPTVTFYGANVNNNTVTQVWNCQYISSNNISRGPGVQINTANSTGTWSINNLWIQPPNNNQQANINRSNPYLIDPNVITALTGSNGKTISTVRFMDSLMTYGGESNYIQPTDPMSGNFNNWRNYNTIKANFQFVRYMNTNPADTTHPWLTNKIYGPQAYFVSGTDSFGSYINLPPTDNGAFIALNFGSQRWSVMELRSLTPHGLTSGQIGGTQCDPTILVPLTNGAPSVRPISTSVIWVSGPNTIVIATYAGGNPPSQNVPQVVASTTEIPLVTASYPNGLTFTVNTPPGSGCIPYEYAGAFCSQLKDSQLHLNLPGIANDALNYSIGQRIAKVARPDLKIVLEYGNETWNAFSVSAYLRGTAALLGYLPPNTTTLGNYYTSSPAVLSSYTVMPLVACHAYDTFTQGWVAGGKPASSVYYAYGSWFTPGFTTGANLAAAVANCVKNNKIKADYVMIAPYAGPGSDTAIADAYTPAGSPAGQPGNWPVDALIDFLRHSQYYNQSVWGVYSSQYNAMQSILGANAPKMYCYEGGISKWLPDNIPFIPQLQHDIYYHPSSYKVIWSYLLANQNGDPTVAGSGCAVFNYFQIYNPIIYKGGSYQSWSLSPNPSVPPGDGKNNQFCTPQGGFPADGYSHGQSNVSPPLKAMVDWCAALPN